ncbi:hypothetical protein CDB18_000303 [Salmonella enterica subsp. enterica serovar Mbandaka]|nr:hypothetical protein [Salmonella enterica subsp. enterica serovar Mbandaka]
MIKTQQLLYFVVNLGYLMFCQRCYLLFLTTQLVDLKSNNVERFWLVYIDGYIASLQQDVLIWKGA